MYFVPQSYQDYVLNKVAECDEQAMCSQPPTTYFNAVRPPLWLISHSYSVGDLVHPPTSNGKIYECTIAGVSGSAEPAWGTTQDQTFTDGSVTWKTHNNYALVNTSRVAGDFTISNYSNVTLNIYGRGLHLAEKTGITTHTAGIINHVALICSTDRTLRYVAPAQTTIGTNEIESGRSTIFYELLFVLANPKALA